MDLKNTKTISSSLINAIESLNDYSTLYVLKGFNIYINNVNILEQSLLLDSLDDFSSNQYKNTEQISNKLKSGNALLCTFEQLLVLTQKQLMGLVINADYVIKIINNSFYNTYYPYSTNIEATQNIKNISTTIKIKQYRKFTALCIYVTKYSSHPILIYLILIFK
ncbi:MAG: hypothetical protein OXF85_00025 [Candidatus Saccharibacteria bacterium]|nr:hypothetical protein [Candidatus Saccharibacteria bacterium]